MKKIISCLVSASMLASLGTGFAVTTAQAAANTPQYQTNARQMEKLNRGLIAAYRNADGRSIQNSEKGVFLSWRLLGTESLENQAFDIYRGTSATGSFTKIKTTGAHDATNYIDTAGTASNYYKVVRKGESAANETAVKASATNVTPRGSEVGNGNSLPGSYTYVDIPIDRPADVARMGDGKTSHYYTVDKDHEGGANDASVGDLDGDGDYELVLKWDPTDSKDSAGADFTGNCYIDAYEIDPDAQAVDDKYRKWRIDLGQNVTSGAHYTQFIVYDFDGDGSAEIAMKTAPGTIDGTGHYVTEVGDTDAIKNTDNTKSYIGTSGRLKGKNPFTQFLTVFDGETGKALATTEYIPYEMHSKTYWGDGSAKYNRSERYLAAVAYIDGVHPSIVMCRGYYNDAVVRTYIWDGTDLTLQWEHDGAKKGATSIYGQGNHNLSVADIDNDGRDEIVYGSVALDDNGVAMGNTYLGHGDAMHVNDFNNDGNQEVFSVKEDKEGYANNAANFRVAGSGQILWGKGAGGDTGRGVMANIDDEYAKTNSNALALGWSSSHANVFDLKGNELNAKPTSAGNGSFDNNLIYWDGDLSRELLDANIVQKYDAANGWSKRFYSSSNGYTFDGGSPNNYTKRNASLSADLWGDWREEVILPINKGSSTEQAYLRIYTSTMPTNYRLTTLMHDSQYRCAIAWQNVGYNQPPHTSYYIGSAALATDASGNTLNYLAPAVPFTKVTYEQPGKIDVTGITLEQSELSVEKGRTEAITANIEPADASTKGITWTSSAPEIVTVTRGVVTGIKPGTAKITATTKDGGFTATCDVTVWSTPVKGIKISNKQLNIGTSLSKKLTAQIIPSDASDQNHTWSSSNPAVASVDEDGTVYGISEGKAVITVTSAEGGYEASCAVNVVPVELVDVTGTEVFKTDNTDSATELSGASASGATLTQTDATVGGNMYKTFEKVSENKAELKFRFTTGGQKYDGSNWNWTGHEYSQSLAILGEDDQNILTLTQPFAEKAGTLMSKNGNNAEEVFSTSWTTVVDGLGNIQGSAKRWIVDIIFDYENNTASATITGTSSTWDTIDGQYTKEFDLNGLSPEKLCAYTTRNGSGTIKCAPKLENVSYIKQIETLPDPYLVTSNGFDGSGQIMKIETTDQAPVTSVDGLTLYIGARSGGADSTTNFAYESGGRSGNALALNSGKFASTNRGPRFAVNTPDASDGDYTMTAEFYAKLVDGTADPVAAELYYNDDPKAMTNDKNTIVNGTKLALTANDWNKITVTISKTGDAVTRVIAVNDTQAAEDEKATFPVFWGSNQINYSKVIIDDLKIRLEQEAIGVIAQTFDVVGTDTAAATVKNNTAEDVTIQLFAAVYNTDGALESVKLVTKEIAAGETDSLEAQNDTAGTLKAFLWKDQEPLAEAIE